MRFFKIVIIALVISLNFINGLSQIPTQGLIGYYPFNGNANDKSGNNNHGLVFGPHLTADRCGYPDSAFFFDGNNDYIELPATDFILNEYTYSVWIMVNSLPPENIDGWMIFSPGSASNGLCQGIGLHPDGGICATSYNIGENPRGSWAKSQSVIKAGQWTHIVTTRNREKVQIYINGTLMPYMQTGIYWPYTNNQDANYDFPNTNVIIGCRSDMTGYNYFNGRIDDLAVYNRVLTSDEIQQLYMTSCRNQTIGGLLSFYPFNGNANDESGSGNDGNVVGPALTTDRCGNPNSAYLFDGINDYIELDHSYLTPYSKGTFAAWVNLNSLNSVQYLGCIGDYDTQDYYISLIRYDPQYGCFSIFRRHPFYADIILGSTIINRDEWYFVVLTSDGNEWNLYVNGIKENLTVINGNNDGDWASDLVGVDNWFLGCIKLPEPYDRAFLNGKLDDVRVYDYALSEPEILELYNYDCPRVLSGINSVCQKQNNVIYSTDMQQNTSYTWTYSGSGATISGNNNIVSVDFSDEATSGRLNVTAINNTDTTKAYIDIIVYGLPAEAGSISGETDLCPNTHDIPYSVLPIQNAANYIWNYSGNGMTFQGNSNAIKAQASGFLSNGTLTVYGVNQCGSGKPSPDLPVFVKEMPANASNISGLHEVCKNAGQIGYSIPLIDHAQEYIWSFTGENTTITGNSDSVFLRIFENSTGGNLTVYGKNECGNGEESDPFLIFINSCSQDNIFNIPNSFSPNGDNINDTFVIRNLSENSRIQIYERSGKIVFESDNYMNDWDGVDMDGEKLSTGVYWYIIQVPGINTDFKGFLYIKE